MINENESTAIEGEIISDSPDDEEKTIVAAKSSREIAVRSNDSALWFQYFAAPAIFLLVAFLGGLRLGAADNEFLFHAPALVCLIFALMLQVLFVRARLIEVDGWFSDAFPPLRNAANTAVMIALFAASMQVFNALIPEQGLLFWIVSFFFLWSLWTNLFAEFETKKLLVSLGSLFGMAFIVKYLILSSFVVPESGFFNALLSGNLTRETLTSLLDLPRYSAGTGYIQFFTLVLYLIGLYILPPVSKGRHSLPVSGKISSETGSLETIS
ncbi:MAG: hypothetical protein KIS76_05960 [Pyrinomonadaceae bacterium]|nr:hypothetical protein [Pyrinomonadaceae bacterium]